MEYHASIKIETACAIIRHKSCGGERLLWARDGQPRVKERGNGDQTGANRQWPEVYDLCLISVSFFMRADQGTQAAEWADGQQGEAEEVDA